MRKNPEEFEELIGIQFKDKDLLSTALTHRSYLNEVNEAKQHNERLEFLGDAVLELVITNYLFKSFPNPEGDLTNWRSAVVRGEVLSDVSLNLGVGEYLKMSKGEEKSGGRTRGVLMANAFEAIIGAIYLDRGYEVAEKFISDHLVARLDKIVEGGAYLDAKSKLQEMTQEKKSRTPVYKVISEMGPDHAKVFTCGVYIDDIEIGRGEGSSKQRAETSAAIDALDKWQD